MAMTDKNADTKVDVKPETTIAQQQSKPLEAVLTHRDDLLPDLEALYTDIHAHPELSMHETRTAGVAADRLRAAGYDVTAGIGKTGVVGLLRNGEGPTVMLRADMDALPVQEATGLPYASTVTATDRDGTTVPVMHACGHDMHVTWLIGAATLMAKSRNAWQGTLMPVFQPAEETGAGVRPGDDVGLLAQLDQGAGDVEHVPGLEPEVELLGDGLGEQLDQRRRVGQGGHRDPAHQPGSDPGHDGQVLPDEAGDLGPLDLDHDLLAGPQHRGVDLGDRRRRHRPVLEAGEDGLQGPAEVLLHHPAHRLPRLGRHLVAALLELRHERLGEDPVPRGDDLAQLDVGRAEPLGGPPQPAGEVGHRLGAAPPPLPRRPDGQADPQMPQRDRHPAPGRQPLGLDQRRHLGSHRRPDVIEPRQPTQPVEVDLPRTGVGERPDAEVRHRQAISFSTRSSSDLNGSLQSTVR